MARSLIFLVFAGLVLILATNTVGILETIQIKWWSYPLTWNIDRVPNLNITTVLAAAAFGFVIYAAVKQQWTAALGGLLLAVALLNGWKLPWQETSQRAASRTAVVSHAANPARVYPEPQIQHLRLRAGQASEWIYAPGCLFFWTNGATVLAKKEPVDTPIKMKNGEFKPDYRYIQFIAPPNQTVTPQYFITSPGSPGWYGGAPCPE